MFDRITDKTEIDAVLRRYMLEPEKQNCAFIANMFDKASNHFHEGFRPTSCTTDANGKRRYSIANGDTQYRRSYCAVNLDDIEYIELLRK